MRLTLCVRTIFSYKYIVKINFRFNKLVCSKKPGKKDLEIDKCWNRRFTPSENYILSDAVLDLRYLTGPLNLTSLVWELDHGYSFHTWPYRHTSQLDTKRRDVSNWQLWYQWYIVSFLLSASSIARYPNLGSRPVAHGLCLLRLLKYLEADLAVQSSLRNRLWLYFSNQVAIDGESKKACLRSCLPASTTTLGSSILSVQQP